MLVVKYKFDKSIYENLIPIFNDGYEGYIVSDEIDSENSNYVIRSVECDTLPTIMRFGSEENDDATDKSLSLLEIIELNTSSLTSCRRMFKNCRNLINVNTENWTLGNVTDMHTMFYYCVKLTSLDVSNFNTSNVKNMHNTFGFCSELTSLDVSNWNTNNVTSMYYTFSNCTKLTSLDVSNWDVSKVTSMTSMFRSCYKLTSLDTSNWIASEVTDIDGMFCDCYLLTSIDVSGFNTSKVTSMSYIFCNCNNLTQLDVSNWDTGNATSMYAMFSGCTNLTSIDVSNFNTSNVTSMGSMFYYCNNLTALDLSNFDTSKVTNMRGIFYYCNNLTALDVSNFDTSKATDMSLTFHNTSSLQYIRCNNTSTINTLAPLLYDRTSSTQGKIITTSSTDVDTTALSSLNWSIDTSSGTKIAEYVYDKSIWNYLVPEFNEGYSGYFVNDRIEDEVNSPNVVTRELVGYGGLPTLMRFGTTITDGNIPVADTYSLLEILNMNTSALETMQMMFYRCCNVSRIDCNWDTSKVTNMYATFSQCTNLTELDVSNFDTSNVTNMNSMFNGCKLLSLDLSKWDTGSVTTMSYMFSGCSNLTLLDVSNFDTSEVTDMGKIFQNCKNLTSLDVSNWDTSNVITMSYMFDNCQSLTSLDVSNWDTKNVTNMNYMFNGCTKLTSLDVSNWDTSNVTRMDYMFRYCFNLTSLDLNNFDTSKVTRMDYMFNGCTNLTQLDVNNFNTSKLTYLYTIFADCINLESLNLSNWNVSNIKDLRYLITSCNKLKTLDISNWNFNSSISFTSNFGGTPLLTDIGMLYCSQDTINKVIPLITDGSKTIWVQDTNASDYTATDYVMFKDYKEDNRTLYLNSPLLEGDEIVNKDGKLYHYHKMGSVVLDGDEDWQVNYGGLTEQTRLETKYYHSNVIDTIAIQSSLIKCNNFPTSNKIFSEDIVGIWILNQIRGLRISSKIKSINEFKQWLSENPTTVVYELAEPYYELISNDPLIVQSYAEGKLDTSSIITPTSIQSVPYEEELTYLYTSTQYCIQFYSTANCTVDITLGGTKVESKSVSVGLNKIYITTPSTLVDNKLIINAKGNATISEVVVVNSNAEFDYFDGLKSSFEDCLVTDVDNENYGKYEVGVRIVGKNKFNFSNYNEFTHDWRWSPTEAPKGVYTSGWNVTPKYFIKKGTYTLTSHSITLWKNVIIFDDNDIAIAQLGHTNAMSTKFIIPYDCYIRIQFYGLFDSNNELRAQIQIEEGTTATPYEPYKETNATIYLNSPLLKGDRIEVVNGKLCHYHKMGMVVLNGSEDWAYNYMNDKYKNWFVHILPEVKIGSMRHTICNTLPVITQTNMESTRGLRLGVTTNVAISLSLDEISSYISSTNHEIKQWLSENPTTVVYELAEPYYEDITPIQSSFVISTVSEGDMEIITDLPIKSNITYLTNIASAVLMEQQLDELDNSTESLTNIVEDEINE